MLYIRVDMNNQIATGHVMRCIAIAEAARTLGEESLFILADDNAVPFLEEKGFSYRILNTVWNDMESELKVLLALISELNITSLFIDSYQVTEKYLRDLRKYVKIAYLDDLNTMIYPVDMLICYANYWNKFNYEDRYQNTRLIMGTKYAPLRKAFFDMQPKIISENVDNILILTGGTDNYDVAWNILKNIDISKYKRINVICGAYYQKYEELKSQYGSYKNILFNQAVSDMEKYMSEADVVISAGGTTMYELCACGTPAISYSIADNQLDNVYSFHEEKVIEYAGDVREKGIFSKINVILEEKYNDKETRTNMSEKMQKKVDGKGAIRIAEILSNM